MLNPMMMVIVAFRIPKMDTFSAVQKCTDEINSLSDIEISDRILHLKSAMETIDQKVDKDMTTF